LKPVPDVLFRRTKIVATLGPATDDPQILAVGKGSPYKSAKELIGAAKGKALKYGTSLVGGVDHIAVVSIARSAGMQQPTIVPFRGGVVARGQFETVVAKASERGSHECEKNCSAGDLRALAVFAEKPMAALPNVPTGKEVGVPGAYSTVRGFVTVVVPHEGNVKALEEGLVKAMKGQLFQTYLETSGQSMDSVVGAGPWKAQLDEFMVEGKKTLEALGLLK